MFPAAIGVLDCTHVRISKPIQFGDKYINRKGFASINVQATCNTQEKLTRVDVQWLSSIHDSRIWRRSGMYLCPNASQYTTSFAPIR
nr:unnamed protein product [Callosobruchus analis]